MIYGGICSTPRGGSCLNVRLNVLGTSLSLSLSSFSVPISNLYRIIVSNTVKQDYQVCSTHPLGRGLGCPGGRGGGILEGGRALAAPLTQDPGRTPALEGRAGPTCHLGSGVMQLLAWAPTGVVVPLPTYLYRYYT